MKLLTTVLFLIGFYLGTFGQTPPKSNWTESDKKQFKSDCLRGVQESMPHLTTKQKNSYCDCSTEKTIKASPNKYSQTDMDVLMNIARECIKEIL
jgi:hypothetical protein